MITLRGVTVQRGDRRVLDRVDLDVADGTLMLLTGPNGSGKTTLGHVLLGLLTPSAGTVAGLPATRAAVFQEDRLCEQLGAVANVRLVLPRGVRASAVVDELRRVGLDPEALGRPVHELSGGQRRRVAIVRAAMAQASLVVLDEPFTGIDADGRPAVTTYVRERCAGRTTVLITHDPAEAEWFATQWGAAGASVIRVRPDRAQRASTTPAPAPAAPGRARPAPAR